MSKEICISSTPHETRLAILEDEQLTEVYYERENEYTLAGSIYKGRVTRVLPGMQSAFVDLGLERDAFLYVTDFMEEQEDSSEFERIPTNGRAEEPQAARQRTPQVAEEEPPRRNGAPPSPSAAVQAPAGEFEDGTRRWRGRRGRRKGFRPGQGGQPGSPVNAEVAAPVPASTSQATSTFDPEARESQHGDPQPRESQPRDTQPRDTQSRDARTAAPISLPGESLSRYGATARTSAPPVEDRATPPRPNVVLTKPSTLIEIPLDWDGGGQLPGESISRYRGDQSEKPAAFAPAVSEDFEPETEPATEQQAAYPHEEVSFASATPYEVAELEPEAILEILEEAPAEEPHTLSAEEPLSPAPAEFEPEEASASYRVEPSALSEFRFAASSSVVEEEEELAPEADITFPEPIAEPPAVDLRPVVSEPEPELSEPEMEAFGGSYSLPADLETDFDETDEDLDVSVGMTGLVEEEEVTDEEEYDFTPLYVESEDHDLQELEEETLDQEVSAGRAIGDMVRDTHLEQRIEGDASGLMVEEEEEEDELEERFADGVAEPEAEEEQAPSGASQPARKPRDDQRRGGRGQRNDGRRRHNGRRQNAQTSDLPIISELLKQGQEILVQIAKEPIAKKGARITSHIALPGRFLVFMPTVNHVGVSRKISSDDERQRLKRILISEKGTVSGGFIVRTAADGASEDDLRADIRFLISLWTEIKQRSDTAKAPALIYHDLNLVERILRDQVSDNFSTIWVDTEVEYERIVRFLNRFQPSLVRRVKLYTKETPLFEQFGIQEEITKALKSKVLA